MSNRPLSLLLLLWGCTSEPPPPEAPACPETTAWPQTLWTFGGQDQTGQSVSTIQRQDGCMRVLVGSPGRLLNEPYYYASGRGAVLQYGATTAQEDPAWDWMIRDCAISVGACDWFLGWSVLSPGDLNADGVDDVVLFSGPVYPDLPTDPDPPLSDLDLPPEELQAANTSYVVLAPVEIPDERSNPDRVLYLDDWQTTQVVPNTRFESSLVATMGTRCGDLDGDGIDDLCASYGVDFGPWTLEGGPARQLTWTSLSPTFATKVQAGVFLGDGRGALVVTDHDRGALHLLPHDLIGDVVPSEVAVATWTLPEGTWVEAMAAADLNGDGTDELALSWTDLSTFGVALLDMDSPGPVLDVATATVGHRGESLAFSDVDQDGTPDLLIGGENEVLLFTQVPAGETLPSEADQTLVGETPAHRYGASLAVDDLDGDGWPELVVGAPGAGEVRVLPHVGKP